MRLVLAALLLASVSACASHDDELPDQMVSSLNQSRQVWEALRDQHGGSYRYERRFQSWTGSWRETSITVENNVVVKRASQTSGGESWTETGAELGTHETSHVAVTIDALYDQCENEVLTKDAAEHWIDLRFAPSGILAGCTFFPKNCADDCAEGVDIRSVVFTR